MTSGALLEATDLQFRYGERRVLAIEQLLLSNGVSCLLGPNGAGKTTLLGLFSTTIQVQQGELRILGFNARDRHMWRDIRRGVGFLPQRFGFLPGHTVQEFMEYMAWLREIPSRDLPRATTAALERVSLASKRHVPLKQLSGGMLRRVGIAQAIVHSPKLLLLDEPTAGLDPAQRLEFRELMDSLASTTAVLLSTHLVEDAAAVAKRVIVLAGGTVRYDGTTSAFSALSPDVGSSRESPLERAYLSVVGEWERS